MPLPHLEEAQLPEQPPHLQPPPEEVRHVPLEPQPHLRDVEAPVALPRWVRVELMEPWQHPPPFAEEVVDLPSRQLEPPFTNPLEPVELECDPQLAVYQKVHTELEKPVEHPQVEEAVRLQLRPRPLQPVAQLPEEVAPPRFRSLPLPLRPGVDQPPARE